MDAKAKYDQAFVESFSLSDPSVLAGLEYNAIQEWDSIGHMSLMAALEEAFGLTLETDDIIEFNSYEKGKDILKKYGVDI